MFEQIELRGKPHLRTLSYDPLTSFESICYLVSTPTAIVVNGASPYTLADLFNAARAKPGELTLASVGPASATHIAFEMLKRTATVSKFKARRRASATIALRFSLSSKATTSGGRLNSMHSQD